MAQKQIILEGIYPILATPFTSEGKVDEKSLRELVRFQISSQVNGIAIFGMASEMYTLLEKERLKIADIVMEEVNGQVPVVFGSGHTGLEGAVELSRQCEQMGADALMVIPPYMAKPDGKRLYEYFAAVAEAVDIPIMMQDAPLASGVPIPVDTMIKLNKIYKNIEYVKVEGPPTTVKITEILEKTDGQLKIFGGMNGMYFFEELTRGAVGTMPACEFPDICVKIYESFKKGDIETAKQTFYKALPLIRIGTMPRYAMSIHKEILKMGGIIESSYVRNPNVPIDDLIRTELNHTLSNLDLLALRWKEVTSTQ